MIIFGLVLVSLVFSLTVMVSAYTNPTTSKDSGLVINPIVRVYDNSSMNNTNNNTNSSLNSTNPILVIANPSVKKGDVIHALIDLGGNPANLIALVLQSTYKINFLCVFNTNGTKIAGCDSMNVIKNPTMNVTTQVSTNVTVNNTNVTTTVNITTTQVIADYEVNVNTTGLFAGNFTSQAFVQSGNTTTNVTAQNITITGDSESLAGCSVRGKDGSLVVGGNTYGTLTKINFFIPLDSAAAGQGELTSQKGKTYFSYKFNVIKVLDNNKQSASILVSGDFREGLNDFRTETSVIMLNKASKKISLVSDDFNLKDMKVSFISKC